MLGFEALGRLAIGDKGGEDAPEINGTLSTQATGSYTASVAGSSVSSGSVAVAAAGIYVLSALGGPIVSGSSAVAAVGDFSGSGAVSVVVSGSVIGTASGDYLPSVLGFATVSGDLNVQAFGENAANIVGSVDVSGDASIQANGQYTASIIGDVDTGFLQAQLTGDYIASSVGHIDIDGSFSTRGARAYQANISGDVDAVGQLSVRALGEYQSVLIGEPIVGGSLTAQVVGSYIGKGFGSSGAYVPRDPARGLIYLVEIDGWSLSNNSVTTFRYATQDFTTRSIDSPSNAFFENRISLPGDYSRSLFSDGRTNGVATIGVGAIELINPDGALDELENYAFDGRKLRIRSMEPDAPIYAKAALLFDGTMQQAEITYRKVIFQIRDRLAELESPLQETLYAGTTISGGLDEAEGLEEDLKGRAKPLCFGAPLNVPGVKSNSFDDIYDLSDTGLSAISVVRDSGVELTASGSDYSSIAALRAASVSSGQYATQLNEGRIKLGAAPIGQITVNPVKGANTSDRTAGQVGRAILLQMGMVEDTDFKSSDIADLDALNSAEIGYWVGADEVSGLDTISAVLNSVGATISPDRLGVYRISRHSEPIGEPELTIDGSDIIEKSGLGLERLATNDQGSGVPAWRINLRYAHNPTTLNVSELESSVSNEFEAFSSQEWRTEVAESVGVKTAHLLSPELTFDTYLISKTAAATEAARLLDLYSVPRFRFRVPVRSALVERIDLGAVVRLKFGRFGLSAGKDFRVIGIDENFKTARTVLDLWG